MNTLKQMKTTIAALLACAVFVGMIVARVIASPKAPEDSQPAETKAKHNLLARVKQWLPRRLQSTPDATAR
jgi:hypothetical protein